MFRPNAGHLQFSSWKAVRKICYTIMQTRTGVEYSSLTCLVRYGLFYRCEKLSTTRTKTTLYFIVIKSVSGWKLDGQVSTPDNHKTFPLSCLQNISKAHQSLYLLDRSDSLFRVRDRGENWWSFLSLRSAKAQGQRNCRDSKGCEFPK